MMPLVTARILVPVRVCWTADQVAGLYVGLDGHAGSACPALGVDHLAAADHDADMSWAWGLHAGEHKISCEAYPDDLLGRILIARWLLDIATAED
jgi:hypothetical protein